MAADQEGKAGAEVSDVAFTAFVQLDLHENFRTRAY